MTRPIDKSGKWRKNTELRADNLQLRNQVAALRTTLATETTKADEEISVLKKAFRNAELTIEAAAGVSEAV